jgi:alkaline phosphatase
MKTTKYFFLSILFIQSFLFASPNCPQNIILMIIDGGGFNHIDAADYYACGKKGEQPFEKFPVKLAMTTYSIGGSYESKKTMEDFNYVAIGCTDSAAAATAMSTGTKTSKNAIGVDTNGNRLEHIIEKCEKLGMATGVVTTVQISHSTPAGFIAHNKSRDNYQQIADEMINQSGLEVILGCGNPLFGNNGEKLDEPNNFEYVGSQKIWDSLVAGSSGKWTLIQSRQEFLNLAESQTPKRVIGLAHASETLQQKRSGKSSVPFDVPLNKNVPNLPEMAKAALNVLDDDPDGFFVMIEAGAVDWASHDNDSARMIEEMIDFDSAVDAVVSWVETKSDWENTLVIITADHQTGYLTNVSSNGKGKLPKMQWNSNKHTNSLVPFYAKGKGSELFADCVKGKDPVYGLYIDNTDIAKVIFALLEQKVSTKK